MPKKFRVTPRYPDPTTPSASGAPQPSTSGGCRVVDQLRARTTLLDATELARILKFENPKRVYGLPIKNMSLGEKGEGALRWDPVDVADFLDQRCA